MKALANQPKNQNGKGRLRLAVIGCGAMARNVHVPVAARSPYFQVTAVVDVVRSRAEGLAAKWDVPWAGTDHRDVAGRADAAIVATPHDTHSQVSCDLLERGLDVLVEKPMAVTIGGADAMIAAAASVRRILAVGLVRRYYTASQFVKRVLESGVLGPLRRFEVTEGGIFRWQVASAFMFQRAAGGGVLGDLGIHVLDLLAWWIGEPQHVEYWDDQMGGVEAECQIRVVYSYGCTGTVVVTRLRDLPNVWRLEFDRGTVELVPGRSFEPEVRLLLNGTALELTNCEEAERGGGTLTAVFLKQLGDFADAIRGQREPFVSGVEGRRSVALMERCYANRQPLVHPWTGAVSSHVKVGTA